MKRYIAGNTLTAAVRCASRLRQSDKIPIFNYAVESNIHPEEADTSMQKLATHPRVDRVSMKFSLFGFDEDRIQRHVEHFLAHRKQLLIDAENEQYYDQYSSLTNRLILEHNTERVNIIKTYQMYRRDSLKQLQEELAFFRSKNAHLGVKLVRGAYFKEDIAKRVVFYNKHDTDYSYNSGVLHLARFNMHTEAVNILATHNQASIDFGRLLNSELRDKCAYSQGPTFEFAHLMGMREHRFQKLLEHDETVNVYVPYGPYRHMLPYCARRLYENLDSLVHIV